MKFFLCVYGCIWMFLGSASCLLAQETASKLVERCIAQRRRITDIHAHLEIINEVLDQEGKLQRNGEEKLDVDVWNDFRQDKHRLDRVGCLSDGEKLPKKVCCWQCPFKGKYTEYQVFDEVGQLPKLISGDNNRLEFVWKLNILGFVPAGTGQLGFASLENNGVWTNRIGDIVPVPDGVLAQLNAGGRFVMVKWEFGGQDDPLVPAAKSVGSGYTSVVLDLEKDCSAVYVESTMSSDGEEMKSVCTSSLKQVDGIWFPNLVVCTMSFNGVVDRIQTTRVSDCSINQGIAFSSISDIGVAKDTLVIAAPGYDDGLWQWDGDSIVEVQADDLSFGPPKRFGGGKLYFVVANLVIFVFCVGYFVRKRMSNVESRG